MRARLYEQGFALPTILISSVVMLIVLVSAASAATSVNTALDRQFFRQLAREAAESGLVRAVDCLKDNNYVAQWSSGSYLRPSTHSPCTGAPYSCVTDNDCILIYPHSWFGRGDYRSYFYVGTPQSQGDSQIVVSTGRVQLLRPDDSVYESIDVRASLRVPKSDSVDDVDAIIFGE